MKAKDYYEKYKDMASYFLLGDEVELIKLTTNLLNDMYKEFNELLEIRHIKTADGIASIVKELNKKINALNRIFMEKDNVSPFQIDGYKNLIIEKAPDIKQYL